MPLSSPINSLMTSTYQRLFRPYLGFLVCLFLAFMAFLPALHHDGLPAGADIAAHFWRTAERAHQMHEGDTTPWAKHFYYGYGAPTFQYTASGFYDVAKYIGTLPFVDDVWALKWTWFIALYLCAAGMYSYADRRWGTKGALLSATAYTFAPVLLATESLGRGAFPVIWGMGWLAVSLALINLNAYKIKISFLFIIVAISALLHSHNLTAITGIGVIVTWFIFQALFNRATMPYLTHIFLVFLWGCLFGISLWLPILTERDLISLDAFQYNPHMQYQHHFYAISQLIGITQPYDFGITIQPERFSMGLVTWLSAVILGGLLIYRRKMMREWVLWALISSGALFLVIPQSQFLWDASSTLQTFIFPARFLNVVALGFAMLIGASATIIPKDWMVGVLMALLIVQGWHSTPIDWRDDFPHEATVADYLHYEFQTNDLATTSADEFKPRSVLILPPATGFLTESLMHNQPATRINVDAHGDGAQFEVMTSTASTYAIQVTLPADTSIEIYMFYFPHWHAYLDDTPIEIYPSGDFGFIRTQVIPAGTHTLKLQYQNALGRVNSLLTINSLSMIALFLIYLAISNFEMKVRQKRGNEAYRAKQARKALREQQRHANMPPIPPYHHPLPMLAVALIGVAILTPLVMRDGVAWVTSSSTKAQLAQYPQNIAFGDSVHLLGYDMGYGEVALYWHLDDMTVNIALYALSDDDQLIAQSNHLDVMGDGRLVRDAHRLNLDGVAQVRVVVWRCTDGTPPDCPRDVLGEVAIAP